LSWKNITNSHNSVRKKSFGGTLGFSNCHIIRLDTGGLVFLVSGINLEIKGYSLAVASYQAISHKQTISLHCTAITTFDRQV
jgi:hypothetical protein